MVRRTTRKVPRLASTMQGVQKWYVAEYEKLGWMVLAKAKGMGHKITEYKASIKRLHETINHLISEYHNSDRKHDLNVLRMNVEVLTDFVRANL